MDIKTIGINPKDAQLLESRSFSVEDICRWFGVDPSMVGHGNAVSNWGTGLEQKMIGFLTFTLRPLLTRIEQAVNKQLLGVNEQGKLYTEFSIEGLLRADSAGRAEFYTTMVTNGIMTRDEVRSKENMPLMGGNSAKQTVQAGFVPLETIGVKDND
jgi:HK97 family phage portal protein